MNSKISVFFCIFIRIKVSIAYVRMINLIIETLFNSDVFYINIISPMRIIFYFFLLLRQ